MKYKEPEIIIPELEALIRPTKDWTDKEDAILKRYYRKVPVKQLAEALNRECGKARTGHAVQCRAQVLGVTGGST